MCEQVSRAGERVGDKPLPTNAARGGYARMASQDVASGNVANPHRIPTAHRNATPTLVSRGGQEQ
jgi:hypothetical protein